MPPGSSATDGWSTVGRVLTGNWRPDYHPGIVRRELAIIGGDLHCTAVKICRRDIDRQWPSSTDSAASDASPAGKQSDTVVVPAGS
jgi:hypothetical protein